MKAMEFPNEANQGQGLLAMPDASYDLVLKHLSELAKTIMHITHTCNEEKDVLKDELQLVCEDIGIPEIRVRTEKD
jgi:hypothetical protein